MQNFNLFTAFCLTAISRVLTTINAVRSVVAVGFAAVAKPTVAGFSAVVFTILLSGVAVPSANAGHYATCKGDECSMSHEEYKKANPVSLPDCKADAGCLVDDSIDWKTITAAEVQTMIDDGAYANATDNTGRTPLHWAVNFEKAEVIPILVKAGADVNATNNYGSTPLHAATVLGQAEVIPVLVKAGADVNAKNQSDWTPLHYAARAGNAEAIPVLIKAGADVNTENNNGETPFHLAANNGYAEIISVLIQAGADINTKDKQNNTPLHTAAKNGDIKIVPILLKAGADVHAKNYKGETPAESAALSGKFEVAEIISPTPNNQPQAKSINLCGKAKKREKSRVWHCSAPTPQSIVMPCEGESSSTVLGTCSILPEAVACKFCPAGGDSSSDWKQQGNNRPSKVILYVNKQPFLEAFPCEPLAIFGFNFGCRK